MKLLAALVISGMLAAAQKAATTRDKCSPAISGTGGNVTITYQSNSCPELDGTTVSKLKDFLAKFPKTVDRLKRRRASRSERRG